jgi:hypothetical protein
MAGPRLGLPGRTGSSNKNTELGALNAIVKKLIELKNINLNTNSKSNLEKLETQANDLVTTYVWLDGGASDQRPDTITYSSSQLGLTVIKTFTYNGGAGTYHVATITLS